MPKGWISFTVEVLHNSEEVMFNFLEDNFEVLEVDHSMIETSSIVRLLLKDRKSKWFIPTVDGSIYNYFIEGSPIEDTFTFKVMLINETQTNSD